MRAMPRQKIWQKSLKIEKIPFPGAGAGGGGGGDGGGSHYHCKHPTFLGIYSLVTVEIL